MSESKDTNGLSPIKRALLEIQELRAKLNEVQSASKEPIAIIGAGLRFPGGANDLESYWDLLINGVDAITDIPSDRWNIDAFYDSNPEAPGKMYTRKGGFLAQIDQFDPHFFGISPREALSMDPQQRLIMQVGWEALENAAQTPDRLDGSQTGVFLGISNNDYGRFLFTEYQDIDLHYATGNSFSVIPGRLSYILGLRGPSIAIDTACSSSLVAIHLACQSLRSGESDLALAGGVNLILTPEMNINFCKAKMMAFDDKCKTFDAEADGYVRGEGCAIIVLKRLTEAIENRDNILAVIRGSAVNQDGRSSGLTAPNGPSQESVIQSALTNANVEPAEVNYLEAHGTGTSLGDPIEVQALAAVLGKGRSPDQPVRVGSVKTNIGHLEAAAGVAGLLKVVLSMQHQEIPPHLHLQKLNPYIPWEKLPVTIPTERTSWHKNSTKRIGSVSSFGFSGTNAHVVLQEAPESQGKTSPGDQPLNERSFQILTLSGKRPEALNELSRRFNKMLAENMVNFNDFCFSSNVGRAHLTHRLAIISRSAEHAREKLDAFVGQRETTGVINGFVQHNNEAGVTFLFTGHGAQYVNMGRQLYETHPSFQSELENCSQLLEPYLDDSLISLLYPTSEESETKASSLLATMTYAQPALFAIEYALARLWQSWGIEPTFVLGHSVGEYAAACIAGVFGLADGLKLVAARGRLMDSLPQAGKMATVFADEKQVASVIAPYSDYVSMAAVNGNTHIVISGIETTLQEITAKFESENIKTRYLDIAQAAHSPLMDPILDDFEKIAEEIGFSAPQISVVSAMTGEVISAEEITSPRYWRRHMREPVQFAKGMETLKLEGQRTFVEIGPQPTLLGMGRRCLPDLEDTGLWLPSIRKGQEDWQEILESLGRLYVNGANVNWEEFERPYPGRRIPLPAYPWAKESYWKKPEKPSYSPTDLSQSHPLWETLVASGRKQAQYAPLDLAVYTYQSKWNVLDRLTTAYIVHAFREMDLFTQSGESHSVETILSEAKIQDRYSGLLSRWLQNLAENNLLNKDASRFTCVEPLTVLTLEDLRNEAKTILSDLSPILDYLGRCGSKLVAVLTGKENPLETLFPEGSYVTADYLYNNWPLIRYFYGILQTVIETLGKNIPPNRRLRVMEIGAGTGGATVSVLPFLSAHQTQYEFTDMSDFFLVRAQEKFREYSFLKYGILNIEKDPQLQGYDAGSYDLVIAANALHATRNLEEAIAHAKTLLAPGGFLILFEGTKYLSWFDITTSLIEGWELFDDSLRANVPLISPSQWSKALHEGGFERVVTLPEDPNLSDLLAHNIIMAQIPATADGLEITDQVAEDELLQSALPQTSDEVRGSDADLNAVLANALPGDRHEILMNHVREQVTRILRLAPSFPVGRKDRLMDLGLDSLMAVELRSRLSKGLKPKRPLSATLAFDYPTIESIAKYLEAELFGVEANPGEDVSATKVGVDLDSGLSNIDDLSEEEVEALVLKKFDDQA